MIALWLVIKLRRQSENKSSYGKNRLMLHEQSFLGMKVVIMTRLFMRMAKSKNHISAVDIMAVPSVVPGDPGELGDLGELGDPGVPGNK